MTQSACCHSPEKKSAPFYRTLLFWAFLGNLFPFLLGKYWSPFEPFRNALGHYWSMVAFPLGLGFLLGGVIEHFIPREYISKHLAGDKKRAIFYGAGLGFLMSACNHGILALSMELHKKGASGPAVISFLLASPWANLPITILLVSFFGWKGILIIFLSMITALSTGLIFQHLDRLGWIDRNPHTVEVAPGFSIREDMIRRTRAYRWSIQGFGRELAAIGRGMTSLGNMVLGWVLFGVILASLSSAYVPAHIFHQYLGPSLFGLAMTILFSAVLEVCSEGTSPLAFEIYKQTGAFGNAFAFLMGGVVTDYTEIGLVWKNLGKRTALWMVAVNLPQVMFLAWILNFLKM